MIKYVITADNGAADESIVEFVVGYGDMSPVIMNVREHNDGPMQTHHISRDDLRKLASLI